MTIDEKIKFWREVMQYARDRGIDVYWFTWNIFVWGTEGKYGITEDGNNPDDHRVLPGQCARDRADLSRCWRASASPPART